MTKKEQLRRRIIELIHKVPYEKLSSEEKSISIYLGTLLLAIDMSYKSVDYTLFPQKKFNYYYTGGDIIFQKYSETDIVIGWYTRNKILKEATLDDQSEETINTLHQLLCQNAHN